jgi:hypothetical protein
MFLARLGILGVALQSGVLFAAEPQSAAPAAEPDRVRISFSPLSGCPDKASFVAQIASRVTIPWLADETELARQIRVTLEPSPAGFSARMEYVDESGRTVTRSLEAPDCAQATAAIALVTAMAIESQAAQPVPLHARSPAEPVPTPAGQEPARGATGLDDTKQVQALTPATSIAVANSRDKGASAPKADGPRHEAGVLAGYAQGVGPDFAFGGAVSWGFGKEPFSSLRAIARWYETRHELDGAGAITAHFRVIAAGPQVCGGRVLVGALTQAVCLGIEFGQYFAEGIASDEAVYVPETHYLFWTAAELSLPFRVAGKAVFVELHPSARFPLVSGTFEFQTPDEFVYEIPRVAFGLNLAVGVTFR